MPNNQLFRDAARAIALGDVERGKELDAQVSREDRPAYFVFLSAVMAGAIDHHFGEDHPSRDEVARFVDQIRYEYRNAQGGPKPLVIEAVVRAFYGEDHLLDDVSSEDQISATFPIIRSIVDRSDHMKLNLDKYFDDAEMLAREWTSDEG